MKATMAKDEHMLCAYQAEKHPHIWYFRRQYCHEYDLRCKKITQILWYH